MYQNSFLNGCVWFYGLFIRFGSVLQSLFLLYMRLTWGHQFLRAGLNKFHAIHETVQSFTALNIPHPDFHAHAVAFFETVGGFLLFVGLGSRIASIPLIIIMLSALGTAHAANISNFRFLLEPLSLVREAPYPFLITSLMVFVFGPGKISLDALLKRWIERQPKW